MIGKAERREFEAFVRRSSDHLLRTAFLLCGDRDHGQDLVQTALMRTARNWRSASRNPDAYARRVVVNLVTDRWRSKARRPTEVSLDAVVRVPMVATPADGVVDRDELLRAASLLPARQRAVLVLRFFDDLSVEETAAALGISTGTVKSQTARAVGALRQALRTADYPYHLTSKEISC